MKETTRNCVVCGEPYKTERPYAGLCPKCDKELKPTEEKE